MVVNQSETNVLPSSLRGRSLHTKLIPTVCNLKNMLSKLVEVNGDVSGSAFREENFFEIDQKDNVWTSLPLEKAKKRYWGIQRAVAIDIPLIDITSPELIRTEIFQKLMSLPE